LRTLILQSGRVRTSHYSRPIQSLTGQSEFSDEKVYQGLMSVKPDYSVQKYICITRHNRVVNEQATKFHAELQFNYIYTGYQLEHARVLSLLDAVGVNLNPAIIWNAIPWSFVVDWVFGVSRWLNEQRIGLMEPKVNILQYLWSVKRDRTIYLSSTVKCPSVFGTGLTFPASSITHPEVRETAYRRVAGLPSASSIQSSGLSLREFSLGAALGITRRPHRKGLWRRASAAKKVLLTRLLYGG